MGKWSNPHPNRKLTPIEAEQALFFMIEKEETYEDVARMFNVSPKTMQDLRKRRTYKEIKLRKL